MTYRWETMSRIAAARVLAVVRAGGPEEAFEAASAVLAAGLPVVELALTTPGALQAIERVVAASPDALVGAGTVLDGPSARLAVLAGARFLVAPQFDPDVVRVAHRYGAAAIPGCATASEMTAALAAGADAVKLFPAATWTPRALAALRAALPQLPCVPTGGIALDEARAWVEAGAVAVGIGSSLTSGGPGEAARRARVLLDSLAAGGHRGRGPGSVRSAGGRAAPAVTGARDRGGPG